jgi:hypothetical protein
MLLTVTLSITKLYYIKRAKFAKKIINTISITLLGKYQVENLSIKFYETSEGEDIHEEKASY